MLYWLTALSDGGDFFNLFRYITFRAGGAFFTALIFGFLFGRPLIDVLIKSQGRGQPIRGDGPETHFAKAGTPTMGGLLILSALLTATLLWARLDNVFVWIVLLVTFCFGLIGFADDFAKVSKQTTAGVSGRMRLLLGCIISGIAAYATAANHPEALQFQLALPVFKDTLLNTVWFSVPNDTLKPTKLIPSPEGRTIGALPRSSLLLFLFSKFFSFLFFCLSALLSETFFAEISDGGKSKLNPSFLKV